MRSPDGRFEIRYTSRTTTYIYDVTHETWEVVNLRARAVVAAFHADDTSGTSKGALAVRFGGDGLSVVATYDDGREERVPLPGADPSG